MRTLHAYGDSHISQHSSWDKFNIAGLRVSCNWLGPKLMYSFGRDNMMVVNKVQPNDIVLFSFGEIDCRCHVGKYKSNWKKCINDMTNAYFKTIANNLIKQPKLTTCVYNIVPPVERALPKNAWLEKDNKLPAVGTDNDRKTYTIYMNSVLQHQCDVYGFTFIDIYTKYIDDSGYLNSELSDGNCHIKDIKYVQNKLIELV